MTGQSLNYTLITGLTIGPKENVYIVLIPLVINGCPGIRLGLQ